MKLLLFLGAGVSAPSKLPMADDLTKELFKPRSGESDETARIRELLSVIKEYDTADIGRPGLSPGAGGLSSSGAIYRGSRSTYEDLFFLCQQITLWSIGLSDNCLATSFMERIEERAQGLLLGSSVEERMHDLAGMGRRMSSYIESVVTETLRQKYITGVDLIRDLAESPDVEQLNIVTLNHDTLVEQFLSEKRVTFVDGFGERDGDVRWNDDTVYERNDARIRIFKLHGSVDWYSFQYNDGGFRPAIFSGTDVTSARDGAGKQLRAELRTPSFLSGINKSDAYQRGIYTDIHFHFYSLLRQCHKILMSGYGWGDTAINFRLDTWLDLSRSHKIVLLHPRPDALTDRSVIFAAGYRPWRQSGKLVCVERWLCDTSLSDLNDVLFRKP
jgi:hypothetical protein